MQVATKRRFRHNLRYSASRAKVACGLSTFKVRVLDEVTSPLNVMDEATSLSTLLACQGLETSSTTANEPSSDCIENAKYTVYGINSEPKIC